MFGKLRRGRVAPAQKPLGIAVPKATFDPSVLGELHSPAAGYPELKALMTGALENPPMRTNAVLAKGLATLQKERNTTVGLSPFVEKERS